MNDLSRLNADSAPTDIEGATSQKELEKESHTAMQEKRFAASDSWRLAARPAGSSIDTHTDVPSHPTVQAAPVEQVDKIEDIEKGQGKKEAEVSPVEASAGIVQVEPLSSEPIPSSTVAELDHTYNCARVVGARLAQLREEKNWLLDDVSAQLKVPVSKLHALEVGEVSVLPDPAFTLGLVRAYSKMLGIDPTPFIEELRHANGPLKEALAKLGMHPELLSKQPLSKPNRVRWQWAALKYQRTRILTLVGLSAACLAIIGLLLFGHQEASLKSVAQEEKTTTITPHSESLPTPTPLSEQPVTAENQTTAPAAPSPVQAPSNVAPPVVAPTEKVSTVTPAVVPGAPKLANESVSTVPLASTPATTHTVPPTPSLSQGTRFAVVHFRVSQDNWISVSQADGKLLYAGLLKAGSERNIRGLAPFQVIAGSKSALDSVTLDGQPVDLSPYTASKQNVVRFNLR